MRLLPPSGHTLSLLGAYIAYPIGKLALRLLTLGYYPPENRPHNTMFVSLTPWWLFGTIITLVYS